MLVRLSIHVATFLIVANALMPGLAAANSNEGAKILLHLASPTTKNTCTPIGGVPTCEAVQTSGDIYPNTYFAYLVVADGDTLAGISGLQCGISYAGALHVGVDIFDWHNCATLEFPSGNWPDSGAGNLITWDATSVCQVSEPGGSGTGVVAVAGYFYCTAYSPDEFRITVRPVDGIAKVSSCEAIETIVDSLALGFASFSVDATVPGYAPCAAEELVSPPPGGSPEAEDLVSSGFDPIAEAFQWPHVVQLSEEKGVVFNGELLTGADVPDVCIGYAPDPGQEGAAPDRVPF